MLEPMFAATRGRLFVATFASHIHRVAAVMIIFSGVYHLAYLVRLAARRKLPLSMLPGPRDVGEIRDKETMQAALLHTLTGHLCLSTIHANNSYHALGRILSFYTPESRPALLSDLAAGLRAIVCQRLVRASAGGRTPAVEVLLNTKLISDLIEKGDFSGAKEAMENAIQLVVPMEVEVKIADNWLEAH